MKRYESLQRLFWVLAAGLSAGISHATTATVTATNTNGDTLVVDSDTYNNIQNFNITGGSLTTELVGMSGGTLTLSPNYFPSTLTLDGTDDTDKIIADSFVFDSVLDAGPMTLRLTPAATQIFTMSGDFTSTRPSDVIEVAGDQNTAQPHFTGDLSGFRSHLKITSGITFLEGTNNVMSHADGGLITVSSNAPAGLVIGTTGTRDIGASGSGLIIHTDNGNPVYFNGTGTQTVYAGFSGTGSVQVTAGTHTFTGPYFNAAGGLVASGGSATLSVPTSMPLSLSGSGNLILSPPSSATYSGALSHTSSGALTINSPGNVLTFTGTPSGSNGSVVVQAGELRLEETAMNVNSDYSGSGTLHFFVDAAQLDVMSSQITGGLTIKKSGSETIRFLTSTTFDPTGPIFIDQGIINCDGTIGTNFYSSTQDIAIASGAEMQLDIDNSAGSITDISGRTFSGDGMLRLYVGGASDHVVFGGSSIDVDTIRVEQAPSNIGGTFRLVFDGVLPSSNIQRTSALQVLRFTGVSGTHNGTIDAASDSGAPVELVNSSDITFTNAGDFTATVSVDATSTARFEGSAINPGRILSGPGDYVLSPTGTHTIASDIWTGSGTLTIEGGSGTENQFTINAAQSFTGTIELLEGNITSNLTSLFPNASAVNVRNDSYLHFLGTAADASNVNVFDSGILDGVVLGATLTGEGLVMEASATEDDVYTDSLESFTDSIIARSSFTLNLNATQVALGEDPSSSYVMEEDAVDGSMSFSGGTEMLLRGNPRFNSGAGKFFKLNSAALKHHPTASGRIKRLFGTGGFSVDTGDLTIDTQFARRIEEDTDQGLRLNSTGRVIKGGFGTFAIKKALATARNSNTTSTIIVNNGNLELHASSSADAIAGASGPGTATDIEMARSTNLDFHLAADATFSRFAAGDGGMRFYADGSARTLTFDGSNHGAKGRYTLATKGDFIVGDNVTVVMQNNEVDNTGDIEWRPGSAAKIEISDTGGGITFSGVRIIPEGNHFNATGGTLSVANSTELGVMGTNVQEVLLGNTTDSLAIGSGATLRFWDLAAGKRAEIQYALTSGNSTSAVVLDDAGTLHIEHADLSSFSGVLRNNADGHLIIKNKATADVGSGITLDFGSAGGLTTFDLNADLRLANLATSTANFEKRGTGNLIFEQANLTDCTGDFNIYSGRSEWNQTNRNSSDLTIVHRGATLAISREWLEHIDPIEVGHLELRSGSRLILSEQQWGTPSSASAFTGDLMTVNVSRLDAAAGSEIVFHLHPDRGVAGSLNPDLSSETAPLTIAASFGSGSLTAPIYIRAVAITDAELSANSLFPLIKFANSTDANELASKMKMRPSIKGVASSQFYIGTSYGGVSDTNQGNMYGQPYRYTDSNDSNAQWLVLQINSNEFAPGVLEAKVNFVTQEHPTGAYTIANSLMNQNFDAYTPLDGLLAAVTTHSRSFDYHMSLLRPQSYQDQALALSSTAHILNGAMSQGVAQLAEQQRWSGQLKTELAGTVLASLEEAQNLQSDSQFTSYGRYQSWIHEIKSLGFSTADAQHQVAAEVVGMAVRLTPALAIGLQHTTAEQRYGQNNEQSAGAQHSQYGMAFVQMTAENWSAQSHSTIGWHRNDHERHMTVEVDHGLIDEWQAYSQSQTLSATHKTQVHQSVWGSDKVSLGLGAEVTLAAQHTPRYEEHGAGNLNQVVEAQTHAYALAQPTLALDYRHATKAGFISSRLAAGYQSVLGQSNILSYGLKDFEPRYEAFAEQPEALSGLMASYELGLIMQQGVALQIRCQTLAAKHNQAQLSASYAF